jgi:predicted metal-dependent hydrolase
MRAKVRKEIEQHVDAFARRLGVTPGKLYVMEQRTKWGNCSRQGNLSFNWRLIMATRSVLTYLVAHETLHLAIPDHSQRFWLTLQSICPDMERSRQWLAANSGLIRADLRRAFAVSD